MERGFFSKGVRLPCPSSCLLHPLGAVAHLLCNGRQVAAGGKGAALPDRGCCRSSVNWSLPLPPGGGLFLPRGHPPSAAAASASHRCQLGQTVSHPGGALPAGSPRAFLPLFAHRRRLPVPGGSSGGSTRPPPPHSLMPGQPLPRPPPTAQAQASPPRYKAEEPSGSRTDGGVWPLTKEGRSYANVEWSKRRGREEGARIKILGGISLRDRRGGAAACKGRAELCKYRVWSKGRGSSY